MRVRAQDVEPVVHHLRHVQGEGAAEVRHVRPQEGEVRFLRLHGHDLRGQVLKKYKEKVILL